MGEAVIAAAGARRSLAPQFGHVGVTPPASPLAHSARGPQRPPCLPVWLAACSAPLLAFSVHKRRKLSGFQKFSSFVNRIACKRRPLFALCMVRGCVPPFLAERRVFRLGRGVVHMCNDVWVPCGRSARLDTMPCIGFWLSIRRHKQVDGVKAHSCGYRLDGSELGISAPVFDGAELHAANAQLQSEVDLCQPELQPSNSDSIPERARKFAHMRARV